MISVVGICNLALSNLGAANITDFDEMTAEAAACRQFYDVVRDALLEAFPWEFAATTAPLAQFASNAKAEKWKWAYSRPADCLRVRWVRPAYDQSACFGEPEWTSPYETEGEVIFSNASPAYLKYTRRLEDPTRYPALFTQALCWHLAASIATPLTRKPEIRNAAWQTAERMQSRAAAAESIEMRSTSDHRSEFVASRD